MMTPALLFFLAVVTVVYVLAGGIVLRWLVRRWRHRPDETSRAGRWSRRVVLGLAAAGFGCMAYGWLVEPYWLEVTQVRIETTKLEATARPIRIAHVSDLHSDARPRLEKQLVRAVAAARPDIIVFTGDCINSEAGLPVAKACLRELAALAPTFAVRGNWDRWLWSNLPLFADTGVRELNGDCVPVQLRGETVYLAGVADGDEARVNDALQSVPVGGLTVFLAHSPDAISAAARQPVDICLTGHTHGGQIALPLYGAFITLTRTGKQFEAGLYRVGQTWLYVNRGIGMEGGVAPRVRFWSRPELTIIELAPSLPAGLPRAGG